MSESAKTEDIPAPSAELVLLRVAVAAFLRAMPRKKGERALRDMAEMLAEEENLASVIPIRPAPQRAASVQARKQAVSLFERFLPAWLANLART